MFWHLYKYRIKVLFKNKYLLFWQGMFPIILGTFFFMAFSDITKKSESIENIGVVITTKSDAGDMAENIVKEDQSFATFIDTMVEREMFDVTYATYDEALKLIGDEKVVGALVVEKGDIGTDISLVVSGNGINQTIIKNIINTYKHSEAVITDVINNNPNSLEAVIDDIYSENSINKELSVNSKNMDPYNQYYFALFAMTCMFGASYGIFNTQHSQADQSAVGLRRSSSPTKKMSMVLSEYFAAVTVVELIFVVLFAYLTLILGIDLGDKYLLIFVASFMSTLLGVALGYFFGVILKCKQSAKEAIQMAAIMFLNFLSGLMLGNMKFIIEESCPIINRINPAAIISDCFYSICAYDDMDMYISCIVSTGIWTVVLAVISIVVLRREKYANL